MPGGTTLGMDREDEPVVFGGAVGFIKEDPMHSVISRVVLVGGLALCLGGTGCTADVHDNKADIHDNTVNIDDATVEISTDADVDNVEAGSSVPCEAKATNVVLVEPSATPPEDQAEAAGHFVFFIDSTESAPVLTTAQTNVNITINNTINEGDHKIICQVHKHDGTPTSAKSEIKIHVNAKVTTSG